MSDEQDLREDPERELALFLKRDEGKLTPEETAELTRRLQANAEARCRFYAHNVIGNEIGSLLSDRSWQHPALEAHRKRAQRRRVLPLWGGVALAGSLALVGGAVVWKARPGSTPSAPGVGEAPTRALPARTRPAPPRLSAPPSADPAAVGALPRPPTILSFDFEDGLLPGGKAAQPGDIVACPPGGHGRQCLVGAVIVHDEGRPRYRVSLPLEPVAAVYDPTMVLRFRYWAPKRSRDMTVKVWSPDGSKNVKLDVKQVAVETWTDTQIALADLQPEGPTTVPLERGDRLVWLHISVPVVEGGTIYVDSVELVRRD